MKPSLKTALVAASLFCANRAVAKCTNISGNPSNQYYCAELQASICTPGLTDGICAEIATCTNISGNPSNQYYCAELQASICMPDLTNGICALE